MGKDIVDEIDRLVDESLSRPIVDDYNSDHYDKCFRCSRSWHGLAVTEKIAEMYARGTFEEGYRVDQDDSRILCPGSDFIGPVAQQPGRRGSWFEQITETDFSGVIFTAYRTDWTVITGQRRWWRTQLPSDARIELRREPNRITLEILDASVVFDAENVRFEHEHDDVMIAQSNRPVMSYERRMMDVLAVLAPGIGGTWTPLTAPGVTGHPDDLSAPPYTAQRYTYTDSRDGRGYTMADIEDLRAAGWRDVGAIVDDGPTINARTWFPVDPPPVTPRTRAEILEARQAANAAQEQRLERFRVRPEDVR